MNIAIEHLEKELLLERNRSIDLDRENHKVRTENFIISEELNFIKEELKIKKEEFRLLNIDMKNLQFTYKDASEELNEAYDQIKYWYKLKYPSLREIIIVRLKNACNNFKRFIKTLWESRLQFVRADKALF